MNCLSFSKMLAVSACLAGTGLFLVSCSLDKNPTAVSLENGSQTTASVSCPWSEADIGSTGAAGSATPTKNLFVVKGAGGDIQGTADAFHFVYKTLSGDGELTMAPQTITNVNGSQPNGWAKVGLMIRDNLTSGSRNVLIAVTPSNGVTGQYRSVANSSTTWIGGNGERVPYYLKIRRSRSGTLVETFKSSNGQNWTPVHAVGGVVSTGTVYIGMVVCSHASGTLTQSNMMMCTPAAITSHPQSTTACLGTWAGFSFQDDSQGCPIYSYQWYKNGVAISNGSYYAGAQASTLYIYGTGSTYGNYYCNINYLGMITTTQTVSFTQQTTGCN